MDDGDKTAKQFDEAFLQPDGTFILHSFSRDVDYDIPLELPQLHFWPFVFEYNIMHQLSC